MDKSNKEIHAFFDHIKSQDASMDLPSYDTLVTPKHKKNPIRYAALLAVASVLVLVFWNTTQKPSPSAGQEPVITITFGGAESEQPAGWDAMESISEWEASSDYLINEFENY